MHILYFLPPFPEIQCPVYSHFEPQGTGCPATCSNPSAPMNCPLPSQESCICDPGYILSAGECVPEANCGCIFEGFYYAEGQSVVLDGDCGRRCVCSSMSMTCHQHQCGPAELCEVHDGVRGCRPTGYATCSVEDLGSYHTFDGLSFRYPGACGLTLARVMGPSPLPHFVLTVEKVPRGLQDFARLLKFEAEGIQVSIEMGEGSNVKVRQNMKSLCFYSVQEHNCIIQNHTLDGKVSWHCLSLFSGGWTDGRSACQCWLWSNPHLSQQCEGFCFGNKLWGDCKSRLATHCQSHGAEHIQRYTRRSVWELQWRHFWWVLHSRCCPVEWRSAVCGQLAWWFPISPLWGPKWQLGTRTLSEQQPVHWTL